MDKEEWLKTLLARKKKWSESYDNNFGKIHKLWNKYAKKTGYDKTMIGSPERMDKIKEINALKGKMYERLIAREFRLNRLGKRLNKRIARLKAAIEKEKNNVSK